jgi:hypothetical protein
VIDDAIAYAELTGTRFRVRLDAGRFSPDWVTEMGSVVVVDPEGGGSPGSMGEFLVPLWWTDEFLAAHDNFLRRLARNYDGVVSAFTLCAPMTVYCEPFIKKAPHPETRENLEEAGYSKRRDRIAFLRAIDMHERHFRQSRTILTLNPGQTYVPSTGSWDLGDLEHVTSISDRFLRRLGRRAILQNNSLCRGRVLASEQPPKAYPPLFAYMRRQRRQGIPIAFQTAVGTALGETAEERAEGMRWAIERAIRWGAHLVEPPPHLPSTPEYVLSDEEIATYDAALRAN